MNILQAPQTIGELQFVGANTVGPQVTITLPSVLIAPSKPLAVISDEWGEITLDGEVLGNITTGSFGTITTSSSAGSPNINNYYVGKGVVTWNGSDVGNVSKFEFTPEAKILDHYTSRLGTKFLDLAIVQVKSAKVSMVMDEWSLANLALVLMAE
jgi:hypothetical protein